MVGSLPGRRCRCVEAGVEVIAGVIVCCCSLFGMTVLCLRIFVFVWLPLVILLVCRCVYLCFMVVCIGNFVHSFKIRISHFEWVNNNGCLFGLFFVLFLFPHFFLYLVLSPSLLFSLTLYCPFCFFFAVVLLLFAYIQAYTNTDTCTHPSMHTQTQALIQAYTDTGTYPSIHRHVHIHTSKHTQHTGIHSSIHQPWTNTCTYTHTPATW